MKGNLKQENKKWFVVYEDLLTVYPFPQTKIQKLPIQTESIKIEELTPNKEVEFEIITIDNGDNGIRYAHIMTSNQIKENKEKSKKTEIDYKNTYREKNLPLQFKYSKPCQMCGDNVDDIWTQPLCDGCLEALKELILEKKEYIKKYKK